MEKSTDRRFFLIQGVWLDENGEWDGRRMGET